MPQPIKVSEYPPLVINSFSPTTPASESMKTIEIMDGMIAIDLRRAEVGKRAATYAVFASVGMSNEEIGQTTGRSPLTIKSHMQNIFDRVGVNGRSNIAEWLFNVGAYEVVQAATSPRLTSREIQIMNSLVEGLQNTEIGKRLHISTNTVKTHMQRIADKVGFTDRSAVALASFVISKPEFKTPAA